MKNNFLDLFFMKMWQAFNVRIFKYSLYFQLIAYLTLFLKSIFKKRFEKNQVNLKNQLGYFLKKHLISDIPKQFLDKMLLIKTF